ncbi:hypothetical protein FNYG_15289 [Fusarium nygamai]|uniref:Uncharacterized protein n=1 Tax=Gibberella nygamai TaxID=42673 RepID=A0A2K0UGQ1_GIBNY|nr:hypothetical protein FNYG_15289 [Fusarium nygamai]
MDLWLAVYAYWALIILALFSVTAWIFVEEDGKIWTGPILLVEAWISMYPSLKLLTAIHGQRPRLFAWAVATDLFLTSTRHGAAYMALVITIWLILLGYGGLALLMGTFMGMADPPHTPHWHWSLFFLFWIGYLSLFAHLLYVWVASIRVASFGPRGAIALD